MVHYPDSENMGQNLSLPRGRRTSLRSFVKRNSNIKNNLSHTFVIQENDEPFEQLNINLATEEELMTLPGINRDIARSIVEHRKAIGRFRKVEDLALVHGIGANKLEFLRPEVCVVTRRVPISGQSSRAPSYDSLKSSDSRVTLKSNKLVNINKATVFDLQTVSGITQEIAANIVHYRTKKGPFKKVDDLRKVKSINHMRLDNISRYLTTENEDDESSSEQETPRPSILTNGYTMPSSVPYNGHINNGHLHTSAINGLSMSSTMDIFELLSTYSPRPIIKEYFKGSRDGDPAIRLASWNMHGFSYEKASNLGVKEVLCRTILENGWSIIAVQDIQNVTALRSICEELNKPKLRRVEEWKDKSHSWNFCMLDSYDSKLGFIYDSDGASHVELVSLCEGPEDTKKHCEVLLAMFLIGGLNVQLVNMKLNKMANTKIIQEAVAQLIHEDDMVMFFIDFSGFKEDKDGFFPLANLNSVFSPSTNTNFAIMHKPSPANISNILYNKNLGRNLTGNNGVVRQGLTHLAIPNGWSWGGSVSPYCPVWTEMYLNPILRDTAL